MHDVKKMEPMIRKNELPREEKSTLTKIQITRNHKTTKQKYNLHQELPQPVPISVTAQIWASNTTEPNNRESIVASLLKCNTRFLIELESS